MQEQPQQKTSGAVQPTVAQVGPTGAASKMKSDVSGPRQLQIYSY